MTFIQEKQKEARKGKVNHKGVFWFGEKELDTLIATTIQDTVKKTLGIVEKRGSYCHYGHKFTAQCERCVARAEMQGDIENDIQTLTRLSEDK